MSDPSQQQLFWGALREAFSHLEEGDAAAALSALLDVRESGLVNKELDKYIDSLRDRPTPQALENTRQWVGALIAESQGFEGDFERLVDELSESSFETSQGADGSGEALDPFADAFDSIDFEALTAFEPAPEPSSRQAAAPSIDSEPDTPQLIDEFELVDEVGQFLNTGELEPFEPANLSDLAGSPDDEVLKDIPEDKRPEPAENDPKTTAQDEAIDDFSWGDASSEEADSPGPAAGITTAQDGSLAGFSIFDDLAAELSEAAAEEEPEKTPEDHQIGSADPPAAAEERPKPRGLRETVKRPSVTPEQRGSARSAAREEQPDEDDDLDFDFDLGFSQPSAREVSSASIPQPFASPQTSSDQRPIQPDEEQSDDFDFDFDLGLQNPESRREGGFSAGAQKSTSPVQQLEPSKADPQRRLAPTPMSLPVAERGDEASGRANYRRPSGDSFFQIPRPAPRRRPDTVAKLDDQDFSDLADSLAEQNQPDKYPQESSGVRTPYRGEPLMGPSADRTPAPTSAPSTDSLAGSPGRSREDTPNPFAYDEPTGVHQISVAEDPSFVLEEVYPGDGPREQSAAHSLLAEARRHFDEGRYEAAHDFLSALMIRDDAPATVQEFMRAVEERLILGLEKQLGALSHTPSLSISMAELPKMNLDHRFGYLLSQVDGMSSFEDIIELSSMSRLETLQVLTDMLKRGIISQS